MEMFSWHKMDLHVTGGAWNWSNTVGKQNNVEEQCKKSGKTSMSASMLSYPIKVTTANEKQLT